MYIFFISFFFWANFFSVLSEYFEQNCGNWNLPVDKKPLKKIRFFEKNVGVFVFFVRNERKIFNLLTKTFWQGCENCFQRLHRIILRSCVWKKNQIHLPSLHTELTFIGIQSKIFQQGCHKNHLNFQSFPDFERKIFSLLSGKLPTGLPKLNSICLQEQIEKKIS